MLFFAVAHLLRMQDGTYAVRSTDYPGCEGRSSQMWPARERFRTVLADRLRQMLEHGEVPRLYCSLEEVEAIFMAHCRVQIPAPDRLPNSFDLGLIELVRLSPEHTNCFMTMRAARKNGGRTIAEPDDTRTKRHGVDPEKRGGGDTRTDRPYLGRPATPFTPKLDLIARRHAGDWEIFIDATALGASNLRIVQGDDPSHRLNEFQSLIFGPIRDLITPIQLFRGDDKLQKKMLHTETSTPLFFHLVDRDFARLVTRPTRGINLAMIPQHWTYNERRSGPWPIEPESAGIAGYVMNYVSPGRSEILAFDRPGEEPFEMRLTGPRFHLEGHHLPDAEERMGPLFVGELPTLRGTERGLASVNAVVVGEEGPGTGKWRKVYKLSGNHQGTSFSPDDIRTQGSGWYFIRLYNANDDLIDSLDFRYCKGLRHFERSPRNLEAAAHTSQVRVDFIHDEGVKVRSIEGIPPDYLTSFEPQSSTFAWTPTPTLRETVFEVDSTGKPIRVTLDTDCVWWAWANCTQEQNSSNWQRLAVELQHDAFSPTSNAELLIRLPPATKPKVFVGFQRNNRRALQVRSSGLVSVRLHEFSEAPELSRIGKQELSLWVDEGEGEFDFSVATVNVSKKCLWCETQTLDEEELVQHLLTKHHDRCFERLRLQGEGLSALATKRVMFVCLECGESYPSSLLPDENPITRLSNHSHKHGKMSYRKVDDAEDVSRLLKSKEKWVWKCLFGDCKPIVPAATDAAALSDKSAHLREEHRAELFGA